MRWAIARFVWRTAGWWLGLALVGSILGLIVTSPDARGHEWYTGLKQPGTGFDCCGGNDCKAYPHRANDSETEFELLINGKWWPVPPDRVLGLFSPDGQAHACCFYPGNGDVQGCEAKERVFFRCVVLPGSGV